MSQVAELAELEGAIADAELADDEAELVREMTQTGLSPAEAIAAVLAEREPAPAADAQPGEFSDEGDEPSDKQIRALVRETERHEQAVRKIMGGFVQGFAECPKCEGMGLVPPGPEPQTHEWFKPCDTCSGFGEVLTGSHRSGHVSRDCPRCKGRGYLEAMQDGRALADPQPQPFQAPSAATPLEPIAATAPANGAAAPAIEFGTPAWMGDPTVGS